MGQIFGGLFLLLAVILFSKPLALLLMAMIANPVLLVAAVICCFIAMVVLR